MTAILTFDWIFKNLSRNCDLISSKFIIYSSPLDFTSIQSVNSLRKF